MKISLRTAALAGFALMMTSASFIQFAHAADSDMPIVYQEDFEDGSADGWEPTDPAAWKVIDENGNKVYSQFQASKYEPPVRSPFNISWIKDLWVSDCVIDVWMKSTAREYGHRDMCVFFNAQDATHFYYTHIAPAPPDDQHANKIMIVNGEPRLNICTKTNPGIHWEDDTYYHVRVVRDTKSGTIKVYWNDMDNTIQEAKDTTFTFGRIGFGTFDDTGCIDNITIRGIKENPSSTK
ncbi:MAG: hypothetical protein GC154_18185 [bacterium]|nr:hypothetical protein [bacterium]